MSYGFFFYFHPIAIGFVAVYLVFSTKKMAIFKLLLSEIDLRLKIYILLFALKVS